MTMKDQMKKTLEISNVDLMRWYQKGRSFQDVLKAMQASQLTDVPPGELLSRMESRSWAEIWMELEITPTP